MSWRSLLSIALLLGALLTGWAVLRQGDAPPAQPRASLRPDYVLNDFELVVLDREGREAFTLRAPTLVRDPAQKSLDIATPVFTLPPQKPDAAPWLVRAKTGWVSAEGDELRLRGDVVANSRDAQDRPLRMETQALNVFPERDLASTRSAVTITQPGLILTGRRGADARLDAKRVILHDVTARYERTAR
ncbi:MAG TPA: LPS export ABC transporter periplasmic protein LptC [Lysobacter sp.]|nr:LPS export ABC transporter periplasmic protein LptC [Lysobacter sp.]